MRKMKVRDEGTGHVGALNGRLHHHRHKLHVLIGFGAKWLMKDGHEEDV